MVDVSVDLETNIAESVETAESVDICDSDISESDSGGIRCRFLVVSAALADTQK